MWASTSIYQTNFIHLKQSLFSLGRKRNDGEEMADYKSQLKKNSINCFAAQNRTIIFVLFFFQTYDLIVQYKKAHCANYACWILRKVLYIIAVYAACKLLLSVLLLHMHINCFAKQSGSNSNGRKVCKHIKMLW